MPKPTTALSSVLSPLILGSSTFNSQYNHSAFDLPITPIVHRALKSNLIYAFDTSPYYGPAEILLGEALSTSSVARSSYQLLTKVGRIAGSEFDYSPTWIRQSIHRSLRRLKTEYLDVVYCHDVEFVSVEEVVVAVKTLRELRDEGKLRYIGISGYPVHLLCAIAERVLQKTGEPLDVVMSYANYTLQNTILCTEGVERLRTSGRVECVLNASPLGMGLLRHVGVPVGSMGDFHPSPGGMRNACALADEYTTKSGIKLENVALRWAMESWAADGGVVGSSLWPTGANGVSNGNKVGVTVIGVSNVQELDEALRVWRSILDAKSGCAEAIKERDAIARLGKGVRETLGEWLDVVWDSPGADYVRSAPSAVKEMSDEERFPELRRKRRESMVRKKNAMMMTVVEVNA